MNCRKQAGAEIVVEVLVFAHVINLLPFSLRHLFLHQLWSHFFLIRVKTTILTNTSDHQKCHILTCSASQHHVIFRFTSVSQCSSKAPADWGLQKISRCFCSQYYLQAVNLFFFNIQYHKHSLADIEYTFTICSFKLRILRYYLSLARKCTNWKHTCSACILLTYMKAVTNNS